MHRTRSLSPRSTLCWLRPPNSSRATGNADAMVCIQPEGRAVSAHALVPLIEVTYEGQFSQSRARVATIKRETGQLTLD